MGTREQMLAVARRRIWGLRTASDEGRVHVFRYSTSPVGDGEVPEHGDAVDALELEQALLEIRRTSGIGRVVWDGRSRIAIAWDCAAPFATWWKAITTARWLDETTIPLVGRREDPPSETSSSAPSSVHATTHHSGHGNFDAHTGHDGGYSEHGGHYGTTF